MKRTLLISIVFITSMLLLCGFDYFFNVSINWKTNIIASSVGTLYAWFITRKTNFNV